MLYLCCAIIETACILSRCRRQKCCYSNRDTIAMYTVETYIIEILVALIGLSYPFIFQIIARIDDKYHSVNLVHLFRREPLFKCYRTFLILSVLCALAIPFLKTGEYDRTQRFDIVSFQCLTYSLLVVCLFSLAMVFMLIWDYYRPRCLHRRIMSKLSELEKDIVKTIVRNEETIKRLETELRDTELSDLSSHWKEEIKRLRLQNREISEGNIPGDLTFACLADLLRFSIKDGNTSLYLLVSGSFYGIIAKCKNHYTEMSDSGVPNCYPSAIIATINSVVQECINSVSVTPLLSDPSSYLYCLLPFDKPFDVPDNAYGCLWYNLRKYERHAHLMWIESYWSHVVQVACKWQSFTSPSAINASYDAVEGIETAFLRFCRFNQMVCAYLLSRGRYGLLRRMRRYSAEKKYYNPLVPQNLIDMLVTISEVAKSVGKNINYSFESDDDSSENNIAMFWLRLYYIVSMVSFPGSRFDETVGIQCRDDAEAAKLNEAIQSLLSILTIIIEGRSDDMSTEGYVLSAKEYEELLSEFSIDNDTLIELRDRLKSLEVRLIKPEGLSVADAISD